MLTFLSFLSANTWAAANENRAQNTPPEYHWSLEDVKKLASEQNPDLKSALAHLEEAAKRVVEAYSGYLPHISLNANFDDTTLPNPSAGSTGQLGTQLSYSSVVGHINQVLFDFGKVLSEINANQLERDSAEQNAVAVRNAVSLAVQKAFYDVSASKRLVEVAEKGLAKFEETQRRTAVLVRTGAKPSFDLTQANVELSKAKLNLIRAKNANDLAGIVLLNILGMPKRVNFTLKEAPPRVISHPELLNYEDLNSRALANRPELKERELGAQAAIFKLNGETRNYFPTIALDGWYGKYLPNYPVVLSDAWGVGVTVKWDVFDGFKTTGRMGQLAANITVQTARLEKEKLAISAEVAQSLMEVQRSELNLAVATETVEYAKENARLAKKRYDVNIATFLELLVADTSQLTAEAGAVQARYSRENALASLENAINGRLE